MPRPRKWRTVCSLPKNKEFGPLDIPSSTEDPITMTVDEYETIRLIDFEGLTQEECAFQMDVARTTVQGIYNSARKKIAGLFVDGKKITIVGGSYQLCDSHDNVCGQRGLRGGGCHRHGNGALR